MKTKFDKIYILSLISNHDRQKFIKKQFNDLGLDFEFIYGTDFYNFKKDSNNNEITYPYVLPGFNESKSFGCVISHYQAVLQAYELGYKNVLIIEDDICFIKNKLYLIDFLSNIPKDADFVTYDPRFLCNPNKEHYIFLKTLKSCKNKYMFLPNTYQYLCGAMMYGLMNRKTMKLYLNNQRTILKISDHVDGFFENPSVKRYVCTKCLCSDQYNISRNFNSQYLWYQNMYAKIETLNINDFYIPNKFNLFTR